MSSTAQQVIAGLYSAFFNRAPDAEGLSFWSELAVNGNDFETFNELAAGFANHPKFTDTYGLMDNQAYVEAIYLNALGAEGDAEGISYWTAKLNAGMNRSEMVASFVYGALNIDLSDYSVWSQLTLAERTIAQNRQDSITNKANVGLYFAEILDDASNIGNPDDLDNDPAYQASIDVLSGVDYTEASVSAAMLAIDLLDGEGTEPEPDTEPEPEPNVAITVESLIDKSIYNVRDDDGDGIFTDLTILDFYYNGLGTEYQIGDTTVTKEFSYTTLSNGILVLANYGEYHYVRGVQENTGLNALEVLSSEDYSSIIYTPITQAQFSDDFAYFFYDLESANEFANNVFADVVKPTVINLSTPITISFDDPNSELIAYETQIIDNVQAAWDAWDEYIDAHPAAYIEFVVKPIDEPGVLARAGSLSNEWIGDNVWQDSVPFELIHGKDVTELDFDAEILISTQFLNQSGFYDFMPGGVTSDEQISFEELMIHEIGHVLGFNGWFDLSDYDSTYEELVDTQIGAFVGEKAVTANGGAVSLDTEGLYHLDDHIFPDSVMSTYANWGGGQEITNVELAILADIGLPIFEQYLLV